MDKENKKIIYEEDTPVKPTIIDSEGDVKEMLKLIYDLMDITIYASSMEELKHIINNPNEYLSETTDIEKINDLKILLNFGGASYEV